MAHNHVSRKEHHTAEPSSPRGLLAPFSGAEAMHGCRTLSPVPYYRRTPCQHHITQNSSTEPLSPHSCVDLAYHRKKVPTQLAHHKKHLLDASPGPSLSPVSMDTLSIQCIKKAQVLPQPPISLLYLRNVISFPQRPLLPFPIYNSYSNSIRHLFLQLTDFHCKPTLCSSLY